MRFHSKNLTQTKEAADYLLKKINKKAHSKAIVVGLSGELGSGKTTFVRRVGSLLKIKSHIASPTFVIIRRHKLKDSAFKNLIHIDVYRLKSEKELEFLDWNNILKDKGNLIFVEWPENVKKALPKNLINVQFRFINKSERVIKIKWPKKPAKKKVQKKD